MAIQSNGIVDRMNTQELLQALDAAKSAAREAGAKLLPSLGNIDGQEKAGASGLGAIFTKLDLETEQFLYDRLDAFSKDAGLQIGFRGEESGRQHGGDLSWLVDPIDGTASFVRGLPYCMVMIALIDHDEVRAAVIHDIANEDTYWAARGQGAYCNEQRLAVSRRGLKNGLVCFESNVDKPNNLEVYLSLRKRTVPIVGLSSGYEFAMIAAGKLEGKIALDPYGKDWDFAPGSLLVEEAGGIVRNIGSTGYKYSNHDFIIANRQVYHELTSGPEAIFL